MHSVLSNSATRVYQLRHSCAAGCTAHLLALWLLLSIVGTTSCGGDGSDVDAGPDSGAVAGSDVRGSIVSSDGNQSSLANWFLVLMERDTGICRVSQVSPAGGFQFRSVRMARLSTLLLLTPDFRLNSVLSMSGLSEGTVRQYFKPQVVLPRIIHRGEIITFFDESNLEIANFFAQDSMNNGIPEGLDPQTMSLSPSFANVEAPEFSLDATSMDTDLDGVANVKDPDINGNGIPNWFDTDEDSDGIIDVFDQDANGNLVPDILENIGSLYFRDGLDWISVQIARDINAEGGFETSLSLNAKLSGSAPMAIDVRGPPSLLNGSLVDAVNWDRRLLDDGENNDGGADDKLYGRRVLLGDGRLPAGKQVIFIRLVYDASPTPVFLEFPYTFSNLSLGSITAQYNPVLRRVTLDGNPFGSQQEYRWYVDLYGTIEGEEEDLEVLLYTSGAVQAAESKTHVIPEAIMQSGSTYTIQVRAQSLDRIPGYPAYIIKSAPIEVAIP